MQILLRLIPQCGRFVQLLNERMPDAGYQDYERRPIAVWGLHRSGTPCSCLHPLKRPRHAAVAVLGLKTTRPVRTLGPCAVVPIHTHPPSIDTNLALITRLFRDRVQCRSGLVDLVVGVGRHRGGGHRLALAGERFVGRVTITSKIWRMNDNGNVVLLDAGEC